jgi:hypothetical protein
MTDSTKRYYFEIHGLSECALPSLPLLTGGTIIMDSTKYSEQNQCVREAASYINKCRANLTSTQNSETDAKCKTVVETNPFLSGAFREMSDSDLAYQKNRWSNQEIMKIYIAEVDGRHGAVLLHASIFQETVIDGFLYIPENQSVN